MDIATVLSLVSDLYVVTGPFGAAQRAKLEALLVEKLPINNLIPRLLVLTPKFVAVDSRIIDEHFPTMTEPSLDGAEIEYNGKWTCSNDVLVGFKSRNRRAANAAETLLYGIKNPEEQQKHRIVGIGQIWLCPGYGNSVVELYMGVGGRCAGLRLIADPHGWHAGHGFLSFPL